MNAIDKLFRPDSRRSLFQVPVVLLIVAAITVYKMSTGEFDFIRKPLGAAVAAIIAVCVVVLVRFVRGLRIELGLKTAGLAAAATVTSVEHKTGTYPQNPRHGPREWWVIHYKYTDRLGVEHDQSFDTWALDEVNRLESPGATIPVRYNADYPHMFIRLA